LLQPRDVLLRLATEVALRHVVALDLRRDARELLVGQVLRAALGAHPRRLEDVEGGLAPDPVDVGERDPRDLVARNVDTDDARHSAISLARRLRLNLLVAGVRADDAHLAGPPGD